MTPMSRDAVTFVKSNLAITDFVTRLGTLLKTEFVSNDNVEWELYECVFLGLFISVYENEGFTDEGDLDFSNFDLVIGVATNSALIPVDYKYEWPKAFSVALATAVLKDDINAFMVTDDVERVVVRS